MKTALLAACVILLFLFAPGGYCQDNQELIGQAVKIYAGTGQPGDNLIAGFTLAGILGGILFGGIGFIAFMYGRKNAEFRPLFLGVLLMAFPYFIKNTLAMYVVGSVLTAALFIWRE